MSDQARRLLDRAIDNAKRLRREPANAAHFVMSVMRKPPSLASYILDDLGIDVDLLREAIEEISLQSVSAATTSESIPAVVERARFNAERFHCTFVDTEHVLLGAMQLAGPILREAFRSFGVSVEDAIVRAEAISQMAATGAILPARPDQGQETEGKDSSTNSAH